MNAKPGRLGSLILYCALCTTLVASVLAFTVAPVTAATYYVDGNAGDDTYDGQASLWDGTHGPWKTIDHGDIASLVAPGDTVMVAPATYGQGITPAVDLHTVSGVTYRASGPGVVINNITATGARTGIQVSGNDIVIDGFEITGGDDGVVIITGSARVIVQNCNIHDLGSISSPADGPWIVGVLISGATDCVVRGNTIHNMHGGQIHCLASALFDGANNCLLYRNLVHHLDGLTASAFSVGNAVGTKIYNNTVAYSYGLASIWGATNNNTLITNNITANCTLDHAIRDDIAGSIMIESHNLFYNNQLPNVLWPVGVVGDLGPGDFIADPIFVSDTDYHLDPNFSPAIDMGVDLGLDFNGLAPDMGALETTPATGSGIVSGKVTLADGTPLGDVQVMVDMSTRSAVTKADGTYSLELSEGAHTLSVSLPYMDVTPVDPSVTISSATPVEQNFVATAASGGITYYVAPNGDDMADGLAATYDPGTGSGPWKTIDNGDRNLIVLPGDTVIVQPGTYSTSTAADVALLLSRPGVQGNPITYKASGPGVVISNMSTATFRRGLFVGEWWSKIHDLVIDGFEFTGGEHSGLAINTGSKRITVKNCKFHDLGVAGDTQAHIAITVTNASDMDLHDNVVYNLNSTSQRVAAIYTIKAPEPHTYPYTYCDNNRYYRNLVHDCRSSAGGGVFCVDSSQNTQIYNNTVCNSTGCVNMWGAHDGTKIINNIATGITETQPIRNDTEGATVLNSYNLFFENALPSWYGCSQGIGEIDGVDPIFALDYRLASQSPAIDAGIDVGLPFTGAKPDLGAFEGAYPGTVVSAAKLSDIAGKADGVIISLATPMCVTAGSSTLGDGSYYIEEPDRFAGIKVVGGTVVRGDRVKITGFLGTEASGERVLNSAVVTSRTSGDPLTPLSMNNKALGGGPSGFQPGITGASGSNNIGLFVKVYGKVTSTGAGWFVLDDGSGVGVKVVMPTGQAVPGVNTYATVLGISSCEKAGSDTVRMVKAIGPVQPPVAAGIAYSTFGGGKQIWIRSSAFTARSTTGGSPNYLLDPLATINAISGAAYNFPDPAGADRTVQMDWWAQYEIPQSGPNGAPFSLNGTWTWWARISQSANSTVDSDWVIVKGDPHDTAYPAIGSPTTNYNRIEKYFETLGYYGYKFGWFSDQDAATRRTKTFNVINDKVEFRIFERESGPTNGLIDMICWSSNTTYVPADADLLSLSGW